MRVISKKTLREFWEKHPSAKVGLLLWYERICQNSFNNLAQIRQFFPSADGVSNFTVFNRR